MNKEVKLWDLVEFEDKIWQVIHVMTPLAVIQQSNGGSTNDGDKRIVAQSELKVIATDVKSDPGIQTPVADKTDAEPQKEPDKESTPVTEEMKWVQQLKPRSGNQLAIDGIPPANQDGTYVAHLGWRVRVVCQNTNYNGKVFWVSRVNNDQFALSRTKEDAKLQNICVYAYAEDCVAVDDAADSAPKPEADRQATPLDLVGCVVTTKDGKSAAVISGATFTSKHKKKKEWYYVLSALTNDAFTEAQLRAKFNIRAAR